MMKIFTYVRSLGYVNLTEFNYSFIYLFIFYDGAIPVVFLLDRTIPRAHTRPRNRHAVGKSGVGLEHEMWGANPCLMPDHHPGG